MGGDDLLMTRADYAKLEHDRGAAVAAVALVGADGAAGGGQHGDGQLAPVPEGVLALRVGHLLEVVAVALREGGDRRLDGGPGQQVVGIHALQGTSPGSHA